MAGTFPFPDDDNETQQRTGDDVEIFRSVSDPLNLKDSGSAQWRLRNVTGGFHIAR